ncbi:MAG: L-histidine N(alpha)-methyltransferase [Acidobacteriota bacterium]
MPLHTHNETGERLTLHKFAQGGDVNAFSEDVRQGLTAKQKYLLPKYLYDDLGSRLFEAICLLPEYYLTRAEKSILQNQSDEIVSHLPLPSRIVELGSGNAEKTRFLLEALLKRQTTLHYLPIDISEESLRRSSEELLGNYDRLRITAYAADYFRALRSIVKADENEHTVVLFLGSNIGNFSEDEAMNFLQQVRSILEVGDALLLGADLKKSEEILIPAYDDALGVTAAFNLNLLVRMNRELNADFDLRKFQHRAIYNKKFGRVEMHLVSKEEQTVTLKALELRVHFAKGESIHKENSYKFDLEQINSLGLNTGFALQQTWYDPQQQFSFNLLKAQ